MLESSRFNEPAIGIIGGSGLQDMDELVWTDTHPVGIVPSRIGIASGPLVEGRIYGRRVVFLNRHGKGHRLLPHEINHRGNIWALRSLGVRWIISVTAVGSLSEYVEPSCLVIPDQLIDRTGKISTFFGDGIVAHVSMGFPYSSRLRSIIMEQAHQMKDDIEIIDHGTYININGPSFSTNAESCENQSLGATVVGMTNAPEAKLAKEAEIALATIAMVTDYDSWRGFSHVTQKTVSENVKKTAENAKKLILATIPNIPTVPSFEEHFALDDAMITDPEDWPINVANSLAPILEGYSLRRLSSFNQG